MNFKNIVDIIFTDKKRWAQVNDKDKETVFLTSKIPYIKYGIKKM